MMRAAAGARQRLGMRCLGRIVLVSVAAACGTLSFGLEVAQARDCGGSVRCNCGDRVVRNYRMSEELGPCAETGLRLQGRVVFDGGGNAIRGRGERGSVGLLVGRAGSGSEVLDLEVSGFERGVRVSGARRVGVRRVRSHHNGNFTRHEGYGIDLSRGSSDVVLDRVEVHDNADEGIHIGKGVDNNRVTGSHVYDNFRENIYLLANRGNVVERCEISGGGSAALYLKHTRDTIVSHNQIRDRPLMMRGAANGVQLIDNVFKGAAVIAAPYRDAELGLTRPRRITVRGGSIAGISRCVDLRGASEVVFEEVRLDCSQAVLVGGDSSLTLVGAKPPRIECSGRASVQRARRLRVRFVDPQGQALPSAEIRVSSTSSGHPAAVADQQGSFSGLLVTSRGSCPGLKLVDAQEAEVIAGARLRKLEIDKLEGDVVVDSQKSTVDSP